MKCELCKKAPAETVLVRMTDHGEEELYVCKQCARAERVRRQQKTQRTRKVIEISGDMANPPPFVGALLNAFGEMVSEIEKKKDHEKTPERHQFPLDRVPPMFLVGGRLHLEGLHLLGELEATKRALRGLGMELTGLNVDGVNDSAHVYHLTYTGPVAQAKRVVQDLLREERNARVRIVEELPRLFGDSLGRALAILKNCRLLSDGELFDLLSPLLLASFEEFLEGIDERGLRRLMSECDLSGGETLLAPAERDKVDADRADRVNRLFEDVVLNEKAEGLEL